MESTLKVKWEPNQIARPKEQPRNKWYKVCSSKLHNEHKDEDVMFQMNEVTFIGNLNYSHNLAQLKELTEFILETFWVTWPSNVGKGMLSIVQPYGRSQIPMICPIDNLA